MSNALPKAPSDFRLSSLNPEAIARSTRLRAAVYGAGGAKAVEERSGVPHSTLQAYGKGQEWKVSAAAALARACGVSLEWLVYGEGEIGDNLRLPESTPHNLIAQSDGVERDDSYIRIPRLSVRASAGQGNDVVAEELLGYLAIDELFIRQQLRRRPEDLRMISADGDSMDPTIRDGDLLLIDTSIQEISNNRIYVIEINGFLLVKRAQMRLNGSVLITSDNPKYQSETVNPSDRNPMRIIGQVIYQAGPVRS